ncbi:MAG: hypothetical protein R2683_00105 [Bifidobacterium adolescentis]
MGGNIFQQYIDYLKNIFTGKQLGRICNVFPQPSYNVHCFCTAFGPFVLSAQPRLYRSLFNRLLVFGLAGVVVALLITSFPCPPFSKLFLTSGLQFHLHLGVCPYAALVPSQADTPS